MIRRALLVSLFATVPALVCAQEAKLVNCRSLEAAGNFVGPDEVVVDDLVCQKVKSAPTAAAAAKPEPPKPLPGAVISNEEPPNVVDAARASAKRVAAAVEANAEKGAGTTGAAAPAPRPSSGVATQTEEALKPAPAADATDPGEETLSVAEAARANAKRLAEVEANSEKPKAAPVVSSSPPPAMAKMPFTVDAAAKPQPAAVRKAELTEPALAPAKAGVESAPVEATPAPAAPPPERIEPAEVRVTPAGSAPPTAESTPAPAVEIVIPSAPSRKEPASAASPKGKEPTAGPPPRPETNAAQNETVVTSAPSPASETAAPAGSPETISQPDAQPPATTEVEKSPARSSPLPATDAPVSAFYDANAPKNSSNRPAVTLGVVTAPSTGAVVSPAGEPPPNSTNSPAEAAPVAEAAPAEQPEAQPVWPGNAEPNIERERVVETGTFALPKEVPDPNQPPHSKQIAPSPEDGFQEGQRADCRKNITIGGLKGEKLVLGTPKWAAEWIEKNQKRMLDVCFSDTPMQGTRNYLIVFYTSATASGGPEAVSHAASAPQGGSPVAGVGTFTTSYGSTWHYFFDRNVGVTVNSSLDADQPQSQADKVSYATAYTEEGVPVAQHWQSTPKKQIRLNPDDPNVRKESKKERRALEEMEHVADTLLSQMVEEIEKL
jgi:hypothetical protein